MKAINEIYSGHLVALISGLLFIGFGRAIPFFRWYQIFPLFRNASEEEMKRYNPDFVARYFGLFISLIGLLLILNPPILHFFHLEAYRTRIFISSMVIPIILWYIFLTVYKNRIFKE